MRQDRDSRRSRQTAGGRLAVVICAVLLALPFVGPPEARARVTGADLSIIKTTGTTIVGPLQIVDFNLHIRNNGPASAMIGAVEDTTPEGMTYFSSVIPPGWSLIAPATGGTGLIRITKSVVSIGEEEDITISMRVAGTVLADQRITNTATFTSNTPDPVPGNNSSSVQLIVGGGSTDTPAVYDVATGSWFMRNFNSGGVANVTFNFGPGGVTLKPFRGDWNNDGIDTVGLFDQATGAVFLRNSNSAGAADITFSFGPAGSNWLPISGDWNNDGIDTIGLYDPVNSVFFLRNSNSSGAADIAFSFGPAGGGFIPLAGDWNNDAVDSIGLYDPATGAFFLKNANAAGSADSTFAFGTPFSQPLAGDWDGDGDDTIGIVQSGSASWFLRNTNTGGAADFAFSYGVIGQTAVAGDWNGV